MKRIWYMHTKSLNSFHFIFILLSIGNTSLDRRAVKQYFGIVYLSHISNYYLLRRLSFTLNKLRSAFLFRVKRNSTLSAIVATASPRPRSLLRTHPFIRTLSTLAMAISPFHQIAHRMCTWWPHKTSRVSTRFSAWNSA